MSKDIKTEECLFEELENLCNLNNTKSVGFIYEVLSCITQKLYYNEIFLSESDLQFSFAQCVKCKGATEVILEYPILTQHLYDHDEKYYNNIKNAIMQSYSKPRQESKCKNKECTNYDACENCFRSTKFENDRTFIDLRFIHDNEEYFVEFKYKLSDNDIHDVICRHKPENVFCIKNQGAHNLGRHEIYEDIERMEHIKFLKPNAKSFVVLVTNDSQYWRLNGDENNKKQESKYSDFKLAAKINENCNNNKVPDYRKNNQHTKNCNENKKGLEYDSDDKKHRTLFLNDKYAINWANFKQIGDTPFKVLVIDCNSPVRN